MLSFEHCSAGTQHLIPNAAIVHKCPPDALGGTHVTEKVYAEAATAHTVGWTRVTKSLVRRHLAIEFLEPVLDLDDLWGNARRPLDH